MTTPTTWPVPSEAYVDLRFNAGAIDKFLTSEEEFFTDRLGQKKPTVIGIVGSVSILGKPYATEQLAQADIDNGTIPDSAVFTVVSPDSSSSVLIYQNKGGVATYTGRGLADASAVDEALKTSKDIDDRTKGIMTIETGDGSFIWGDKSSRKSMEIKPNGDKVLYGVTQTSQLAVSDEIDMDGEKTISSAGSSYSHAWMGSNYRVGLGMRKGGRTVELHGVPMTTQRGMLPNDVFSIGDSITAFGQAASKPNATGTIYRPLINAQCWAGWAMLMTNGRYRYVGMSATGGYTASQILATHVPKAIAANPSFCMVMCGRNDVVQGIDIESVTIPAMTSIFRQLRYAGIIPVVCTMSAQSNNTDAMNQARYKINAFCRAYAAKYGLPLVDLHTATTDPLTGEWKDGYNQVRSDGSLDPSHPTPMGAKAMGRAVADAMQQWQAPTLPRKSASITTPENSDNQLPNPLFMQHQNGVPDGWVIDSSGTFAIESPTDGVGNTFVMTGSGSSVAAAHITVPVVSGKTAFGASMNISAHQGSWVSCYVVGGSSIADSADTVYLGGVRNWKLSTDGRAYFYYEFDVPEGVSEVTIVAKAQDGTLRIEQGGLFKIIDASGY